MFFLLSNTIFNSVQGSLHIYVQERKLYVKERLSKIYSTSVYFWARSLSVLPVELLYVWLAPGLTYYVCGLLGPWDRFLACLGIHGLVFWACSGIGLLLSSAISVVDLAMTIVPLLTIPMMVVSGFFINVDSISKAYLPLLYFNPYRYATQALFFNEYNQNPNIEPILNPVWPGNKQQFFPDTVWGNCLLLVAIGLILRLAAVLAMWAISTPRKLRFSA
jgi:ABC-type multidrug transport system permease subunit